MKLIIDISENFYKGLQIELKNNPRCPNFDYCEGIIANGTPYEERPQGEWIPEESTFTDLNGIIETYTRFKCSICNQGQNFGEYPFCCWCGADMRGKEE